MESYDASLQANWRNGKWNMKTMNTMQAVYNFILKSTANYKKQARRLAHAAQRLNDASRNGFATDIFKGHSVGP